MSAIQNALISVSLRKTQINQPRHQVAQHAHVWTVGEKPLIHAAFSCEATGPTNCTTS